MAPCSKQSGFTLLEMVLALALIATVSVISLQITQGVLLSSSQFRDKSTRLMQLQLAMNVMENDFSHARLNPLSTNTGEGSGDVTPTVNESGAGDKQEKVHFLRGNWLNPNGLLPRSQIESVTYQLSQGELQKISSGWPENSASAPASVTTLLQEVDAFELRYYLDDRWVEGVNLYQTLPAAVAVTITLNDGKTFRRIYSITGG